MASIAELAAQIVALTDQVNTLTNRLSVAEQNVAMQQQQQNTGTGNGGNKDGVFDKKRLYPKELKEGTSFRSWSERMISWLSMDKDEVAKAFRQAGRQDNAQNLTAYSTCPINILFC